MNKTLEANSVFLNPTHTSCPTRINQILKYCYASLDLLEQLKGQLGADQFNYIDEYFHRIIMTLQNAQTSCNQPPNFTLFTRTYDRNNINQLPKAYENYTINSNLANASYNNQTLSVPKEYKILTTLDKQLAFNKYGEQIVIPYTEQPQDVFKPSQYISGNGFDVSRHVTPMPLDKYK